MQIGQVICDAAKPDDDDSGMKGVEVMGVGQAQQDQAQHVEEHSCTIACQVTNTCRLVPAKGVASLQFRFGIRLEEHLILSLATTTA